MKDQINYKGTNQRDVIKQNYKERMNGINGKID